MRKINKKKTGWIAALLFFCMTGFQMPAPAEWQKPLQLSLACEALACLAIHPLDPAKFLVASGHDKKAA
jgi:hypothetical protein